MKWNKTYILIALFSAVSVWGQDVSFEARASKTEVSVNERFSIQFIVTYGQNNIKVDKPLDLPSFGGLHQLGQSTQSQMSIQNGVVFNQSGIEVVLVADSEGEYNIGSATITINGKKYKTKPIKISVKKGLKPRSKPGQRLQGAFLSAEVTDENPYLNQEVILVVKLYARDYSILNRIKNYDTPDFANLVAKQVSERTADDIKQELVNGQTYVSQELTRYIIYPQKVGKIEIDPFSLGVIVSGYYGSEVVPLTSQPIVLTVKNLPANQPENFSGAVGKYSLNASLSKQETKANKAVNLEVEIIGSGNLNTLKTPTVEIPENIEAYAPKRKEAFEPRPSGLKGKVVDEHILVPQYGGNYTIGPVEFNYFDPNKEKYITLKTKPFNLLVDGPPPPEKPENMDSLAAGEKINDHERRDSASGNSLIIPQKLHRVKDQVVASVSGKNYWIWLLALIPVLIFLFIFLRKRKKPNPEKEKRTSFKSLIQGKLSELKSASDSGNSNLFYSLQEDILTRLGMHFSQTSLSEFTENSVAGKLAARYSEKLADDWKALLLENKQAKYANLTSGADLKTKFKETSTLSGQFFSIK
jgi:hypothetical protein